jgi:hypothetical protein
LLYEIAEQVINPLRVIKPVESLNFVGKKKMMEDLFPEQFSIFDFSHHDNKLITIGSETILFKDSVFPRNNATPSTLRLGRTPRTSGPGSSTTSTNSSV